MRSTNGTRAHLTTPLHAIDFPYRLVEVEHGIWAAYNRLNRHGKAIWQHRIQLSESKLRRLAWNGEIHADKQTGLRTIWLYSDSTDPTLTKSNMDTYQQKLALLMNCKTEHPRG